LSEAALQLLEAADGAVAMAEPPIGPKAPAERFCREQRLLQGYLHKTSNCLCGIKGYAALIAARSGAGTTPDQYARRILQEVARLEQIYGSVREIAFPQRRQVAGERLGRVLRAAAAELCGRSPEACLHLSVPLDGPLLLPAGDLVMILRELLANALEGAQVQRDLGGETSTAGLAEAPTAVRCGIAARGRAVNIRVSTVPAPADCIAVVVRDDGPGVAAELLPQIREPFVTTKAGHLGIGLARVETVMEMHGLDWSLASGPLVGTTVMLQVARREEGNGGQRGRSREG
jgi:signal transduction histidine kinase